MEHARVEEQRVELAAVEARSEEPQTHPLSLFGVDVDVRSAMEGDTPTTLAVEADLHDHGLDEDLTTLYIELVDHRPEAEVVSRGSYDDQSVRGLVSRDLDLSLEERRRAGSLLGRFGAGASFCDFGTGFPRQCAQGR